MIIKNTHACIIVPYFAGIEYWTESDTEIDDDIGIENEHIAPPDIADTLESQENTEIHMTVRWVMLLLSIFQTRFYLTDRSLNWLLKFLATLLHFLGKYSTKIVKIASLLPQSVNKCTNILFDSKNMFERRAVCSKCDTLYTFNECLKKEGLQTSITRCSFKSFSKKCNEPLMKEIISHSGHHKFYPKKVYCFASIISSLQSLLLRTGFMQLCESTRNSFSTETLKFDDVYDGTLWKDFLCVENIPFLSQCNNYALLMNVDWIQPFEHIVYSVGLIYLVILNLPRSVRFKRENVILFGIIPGPCEPSRTINHYLSPLVADLLDLWKGVELSVPGKTSKTLFKCALLGVACDLPAARKVCGFLSYSANLGCSKCYEQFSQGFGIRNCYANFEREKWVLRSNNQHRSNVKKILQCTSKVERDKKESKYGCRYSCLLDLPYFRPVEMLLIDPMHNLFLGTAKHFARDLWIGRSILDTSALNKIEARLRNTIVPTGLGRIPTSINTGCFLTAEQWKNWTLYFSIFCLGDLLPKEQLECWRHFVLACRYLCKFSITNNDVIIADGLFLRFCKRAVQIYGSNAITPNMHLHCHLASCVREFGPIHTFWLFPFERYNGILEGQPTNNRSIELQLMQRFLKDNMHLQFHHEAKQWPSADHFLQALPEPSYDSTTSVLFDQSVVPAGPKFIVGFLPVHLVECLRKLYSALYPSVSNEILNGTVFISSTFKQYAAVKWHGKTIYSNLNNSIRCKNPYVFVVPPFQFTTSVSTEFEGRERLAEIDYFLVHSFIAPDSIEPKSHVLACAKWPMVHPERHHFGKPVEVWCTDTYEPQLDNTFFLASTISARVIISYEKVSSERVRIAIPLVHD